MTIKRVHSSLPRNVAILTPRLFCHIERVELDERRSSRAGRAELEDKKICSVTGKSSGRESWKGENGRVCEVQCVWLEEFGESGERRLVGERGGRERERRRACASLRKVKELRGRSSGMMEWERESQSGVERRIDWFVGFGEGVWSVCIVTYFVSAGETMMRLLLMFSEAEFLELSVFSRN